MASTNCISGLVMASMPLAEKMSTCYYVLNDMSDSSDLVLQTINCVYTDLEVPEVRFVMPDHPSVLYVLKDLYHCLRLVTDLLDVANEQNGMFCFLGLHPHVMPLLLPILCPWKISIQIYKFASYM